MKRMLSGEELLNRAEELGVSTRTEEYQRFGGVIDIERKISEYELQQRVIETERHMRESKLWLVALVSALASLASALAAWFAVFWH